MPTNHYRGTMTPLLQSVRDSSSPVSGFVRTLEYKGVREAEARALFNQYINNGYEAELAVNHGICTLVAVDASGSVTIDTWEIGVNEIVVPSVKNPRHLNGSSGVRSANTELIARAIRDGSTIEEAADALEADTGDIYDTALNAAELRLYKRCLEGRDSFFYHQYVLRHTTNVSNRWGVNISDVGVNMVYNTAALLSETQDSGSWVYPLPGRLAYKINLINSNHPAEPDAFHLNGWLKAASSESTAANNRVNIVTDYKFFTWSTDEYEAF